MLRCGHEANINNKKLLLTYNFTAIILIIEHIFGNYKLLEMFRRLELSRETQ